MTEKLDLFLAVEEMIVGCLDDQPQQSSSPCVEQSRLCWSWFDIIWRRYARKTVFTFSFPVTLTFDI